ncbi:MAG TPA: hypothetical protein VGS19_20905 [Streptosporangiaceae bacterium]|nr:hypothetical protein [Streptosporangiaceae bacterium]
MEYIPAVGLTAATVATAVTELVREAHSARWLVALDGPGGSGKTVLSEALAPKVNGTVVHGDDFYRVMPDAERLLLDAEQGYGQYFDWERLRDQVLAPLRAGRPACYQQYDWAIGALGQWLTVPPSGVVIVEGVYSMRPELSSLYDFTVFVETPREVCSQRCRARGNTSDWINRWRAAEDHYLHTARPRDLADLVVAGS